MVYNTQNYWFLDVVSHLVLKKSKEHSIAETVSVYIFMLGEGYLLCWVP
jgi:hypothetical protein